MSEGRYAAVALLYRKETPKGCSFIIKSILVPFEDRDLDGDLITLKHKAEKHMELYRKDEIVDGWYLISHESTILNSWG